MEKGFFIPLEPLKPADLPARTQPLWKITGPGAVLVGLAIGAGEIIIWPRLTAEFGAGMAWAAVLGVFLQVWINLEIGRWTVATGETIYSGYARVWRGFPLMFIFFLICGWIAPGWGRASGTALKALLVGPAGFGTDTFWTVITFAFVAFLLFGPKLVYRSVERTIVLLVLIITIGLILVALMASSKTAWWELGQGVVNIGYRAPGVSVKTLFIALVFAGAGGTANLFYSFYLRDKKIGMGEKIPVLTSLLHGDPETVPVSGFQYPENPENERSFQSWWRYLKFDQGFFFFFLNTLTVLLFILGALAVLRPRGIIPVPGSLIFDEAVILGQLWGRPGQIVFLLVGVATLFSSQLAIVDGVARSIADMLYTHVQPARKKSLSFWYMLVALIWIGAGILITYFMEKRGVTDLGFLLNAAYMGGFAMAVYVPLTLYLNYRYLPQSARPGFVCTLMMGIASLVYVGFAVSCVYWEFFRS